MNSAFSPARHVAAQRCPAFFVMTGSGELFLIPVVPVAGRIGIAVDCYRQYSVGAIGDLFRADDVDGARAG